MSSCFICIFADQSSVMSADDEPHFMYYVNDGVYGSFNCLMYDHAEVFPKLLKVGRLGY